MSIRAAMAIRWRKGAIRLFSNSFSLPVKQMPPRPKINESEVTGTYLKGSGPGGQKIVSNFFASTLRALIFRRPTLVSSRILSHISQLLQQTSLILKFAVVPSVLHCQNDSLGSLLT